MSDMNLADLAGPSPSEKAGIIPEMIDMSRAEQQAEDEVSAKADALEIWEKAMHSVTWLLPQVNSTRVT